MKLTAHQILYNQILYFIEQSKTIYEHKARGGIAVYLKQNSVTNLDIISNDFNDLIVFNVRDSDTTFAAIYLPPVDSQYYSKESFEALDLICDTFSQKTKFYAFGDLNSRFGTPISPRYQYT